MASEDRPFSRGSRGAARRTLVLVLTAVLAGVWAPTLRAQGADEYQLKAAFLFNFIRFVDWPTDPGEASRLQVCVLGPASVADAFAALDGRSIRDRTLAFRRLVNTEDISTCGVIFAAATASSELADLLPNTTGAPVLTVGETQNFIPDGGIIAFRRAANKIEFAVNLDASERAGLTIRSDLLRLAASVRQGGQAR